MTEQTLARGSDWSDEVVGPVTRDKLDEVCAQQTEGAAG